MKFWTLFLIAFNITPCIVSHNVLVLFPFPGRSHFTSFLNLFKGLAEKGHNVTVVSDHPLEKQLPNYRDIILGVKNEIYNHADVLNLMSLEDADQFSRFKLYSVVFAVTNFGEEICERVFSSRTLQALLEEDNKYDLVLLGDFNFECFVTVAKKLDAPIVRLQANKQFPWANYKYGNPNNPAYLANTLMPFSNHMTFLNRVENTLATVFHSVFYYEVIVTRDKRISSKYFGELGESLQTDILKDSLLLATTHYTVTLPGPLVPNIIEIGGIHIGKSKALPKVRLQNY